MDSLTSGDFCRKFAATNVSSAPKYEHISRLVSQVHMMAGQNVKKKYLMCHIPIKMLKQNVENLFARSLITFTAVPNFT